MVNGTTFTLSEGCFFVFISTGEGEMRTVLAGFYFLTELYDANEDNVDTVSPSQGVIRCQRGQC